MPENAPPTPPTPSELYRALAGGLPDGMVVVFDDALRVVHADGPECTPLDLVRLVGRGLGDVFTNEVLAQLEPRLRAALAGHPRVAEVPWDGRTYRVYTLPVTRSDGSIPAGMVIAQNITQTVLWEEAMREGDKRYRRMFDLAGEAIYILAATGEDAGAILDANAAAASMHGYTVDELLTMTQAQLASPEVTGGTPATVGDRWREGETIHVRSDGTTFPVEFHAGPLELGGRRSILVFARDVTERRRHEAELEAATRAAAAASVAKTAFLANMSHEIRTPLNSILGYAQLLLRTAKHAKEQQYLALIVGAGDHLLALIDDVLRMAKMEAGTQSLTPRNADLHGLLDQLEAMLRMKADAKRLGFEIHRRPDVPRHIVVDEGKLRQVVVNLLGNAVKFTEEGGVTARISVQTAEASALRLIVEVQDTGPGIGPDELGGLFQPFAQAHVGLMAHGGTGLGLALSRQCARLMGGDITVESRLGIGSVFRLEVPIALGEAPLPAAPAPKGRVLRIAGPVRALRILLVDDEEANRGWQRELLEQVGFEVREATNGAEALAGVDAWEPHLVVIDLHMPLLNGADAVRAIRARPGRRVAILALTASPAIGDPRQVMLDAGADASVRKPAREGELLEEIRRLLGIDYCYGEPAPPARKISTTTLARVPKLSPELVRELRSAAGVADYGRLTALINALASDHPQLAEALKEMVDRFDYAQIADLLPP